MKRLPFLILAAIGLMAALAGGITVTSCSGDDVDLTAYTQWRDDNNAWLARMADTTGADGQRYFRLVTAPWNPKGYVLMHYFNDRALTEGNLSPIFTSRVQVRYRGALYDGVPFDSSYLQTAYGPGIAQFDVNALIEGWSLALTDMRVGDSAKVVIPYDMAYGVSSTQGIPPFSNLQFNISLVDIVNYETNPGQ